MTFVFENLTVGQQGMTLPEAPAAAALRNAIYLWAAATTSIASARKRDLVRDKTAAVVAFFNFVGVTHPGDVSAEHVRAWQAHLADKRYGPATVYARVSRLSSFYEWLMRDAVLGGVIQSNPVRFARPKAPRMYQTEATRALNDQQLRALVAVVRRRASAGDLVGLRDYALLLFFLVTGMRRSEVINLRGSDLELEEDTMIIGGQVKGGDYVRREVRDPGLRRALDAYLTAAGRTAALTTNRPLWTRHDNAGQPGAPLTSHAFTRNLKIYAREAGIEHIHLHQTRHTYARLVAERSGSLSETQEALGHKNQSATRVYVQRIAIKKDKYGAEIGSLIADDNEPT